MDSERRPDKSESYQGDASAHRKQIRDDIVKQIINVENQKTERSRADQNHEDMTMVKQ